MAFGKKNDADSAADTTDFVRIPKGTSIETADDGRLRMSFAGDMSFGEEVPELSELVCGRNLSIDPGVAIKAGRVKVEAALELEEGSSLETQELEAERIVSRKGQLTARTISAGQVHCESSRVVADRITARDSVDFDRGEMEIGSIMAQTLHVSPGTKANILIREVAKLEGPIPKGGYENFDEFLAKVYQYHPEILNDQFSGQARKTLGHPSPERAAAAPPATAATEAPASPAGDDKDRFVQLGKRLRGLYSGKEMAPEIASLVGHLEGNRLAEIRRELTPTYQKLTSQGKMPPPVMEILREIQEAARPKKEAAGA